MGAVLGRTLGGVGMAIRLAGLCMVLGGAVALVGDATRELSLWTQMGETAEYIPIMTKALGIAVLCRICSDVCKDCGETTLASAVESVGKLTLVLLAMPMIRRLAQYAIALAEGF
jgi:stage III sporulation protein AD